MLKTSHSWVDFLLFANPEYGAYVKGLTLGGILQDVAVDLLKAAVTDAQAATAIIVEGYPRTKEQLEEFNKHVSTIEG